MTISIDPRVFGSPLVTWPAFTAVLILTLAIALVVFRAPALGLSRTEAYGLSVRLLLSGLVGARLLHVLDYGGYYAQVPAQVFYIWNGGFSAWGGLIGAGAALLWCGRGAGSLARGLADAAVVPAFLGLGVFRLADFLTGQRPGVPTSLPWGVEYAHPASEAYLPGILQHPVALYEMTLVFLVALGFWWLARSRSSLLPAGWRFAAAVTAYAVIRLNLGFAVAGLTHLGLQQDQWIALTVLGGVALLLWRRRRKVGAAKAESVVRETREGYPVTESG